MKRGEIASTRNKPNCGNLLKQLDSNKLEIRFGRSCASFLPP
jgi:hypothetical protein